MNSEIRELLLQHNLPETGSLAVVPFKDKSNDSGTGGIILLVKREPQGFSPDMGSHFLEQISELLSVALSRFSKRADEKTP